MYVFKDNIYNRVLTNSTNNIRSRIVLDMSMITSFLMGIYNDGQEKNEIIPWNPNNLQKVSS